jgi:hypothetical protein
MATKMGIRPSAAIGIVALQFVWACSTSTGPRDQNWGSDVGVGSTPAATIDASDGGDTSDASDSGDAGDTSDTSNASDAGDTSDTSDASDAGDTFAQTSAAERMDGGPVNAQYTADSYTVGGMTL